MSYVLILLALLGAFIWASPARSDVSIPLADSARALGTAARDALIPLRGKGFELLDMLRARAMELVRDQLHQAIDERVQ